MEQLAALRAVPGLTLIRPCDANETAEAWRLAIESKQGPIALSLTRQEVPTLDRKNLGPARGLRRGAYVLCDLGVADNEPEVILMSSGSEVFIALRAAQRLQGKNISVRVVSMPSWTLFKEQEQEYRDKVLPASVSARVAVEAGSSQGWHRYVGRRGRVITLEHFGASASHNVLFEKFGITVRNVEEEAMLLLGSSLLK